MSEKPISYGLTTKARVKDRISISDVNLDTVIDRLIAGVTDFLEGEAGGRRFLETTYLNQVVTIFNECQEFIATKHIPISAVTSLQYRAGLKTDPNWTDFGDDDWEIVDDGLAGLIRVYGIPSGVNMVRLSYTAGYKIDFANAGNATHTLPFDLSDLAERLVIKLFKKREHEGKASEAFEGGTVQWKEFLDDVDKNIISRYRRVASFV